MLCVKNKKYMKKMAGYVVGIVTFIGLSFSLFYFIQLRRNEQSIENYAFYVMDSDSQITLESVDNVLSQQEYYLGCYCIAQKQNIYAQDTKGNVTADVIISDSSLENIIITKGTLLKEDTYGCILSSKIMYRLFGTMKMNGQKIEVFGKDYYVRGIVESDEEWMIVCYSDRNIQAVPDVAGIVMNVDGESYHNKYKEDIENRLQCSNKGGVYYVSDYTTLFGKKDMPKTGTEIFDYMKWKQAWKDILYRKIYKNKDIIERYFYHFTWVHIKWMGLIGLCMFIGFVQIIWRRKS